MNASDRVVITGMGLVTPLGIGKRASWENLRHGRSGIRPITVFDSSGYYGQAAGEVPGLSSDAWFSDHFYHGKSASGLGRGLKLLLLALEEALSESKVPHDDSMSCPLVVGNTLGGMQAGTDYLRHVDRGDSGPFHFSQFKNFLAQKELWQACDVFGLSGPAMVVSNACSSGAHAIQIGRELVRSGEFHYACVGGYEPLAEFTHAGFSSLRAITRSVCRPFDAQRDGMTLGEGAGIMMIERLDRAQKRGARVLAELAGYGERVDAYHLTRTNPEAVGVIHAMTSALAEAALSPEDVGCVVAHATATPANDAAEGMAIHTVFQKRSEPVPVTAWKAMIGHTLGAAGGIEPVLGVLALQNKFIPPMLNHQTTDPACEGLRLVKDHGVPLKGTSVMVNACGFGGLNTTWILRNDVT